MKMVSKALFTTGITALAFAATPAGAVTLLNIVDAPTQSNTPYALSFVATATTTTLSVAGYQVPSSEQVNQNAVRLGAGPNLLVATWVYTPAPTGALAGQGTDGSSVNGLSFAGVAIGSYDIFSQTFATAIGSTYTYSFLYTNSVSNSPSGLRVDVTANAGAVPEPATWAMMIAGFGVVGGTMRRRARITTRLSYAS